MSACVRRVELVELISFMDVKCLVGKAELEELIIQLHSISDYGSVPDAAVAAVAAATQITRTIALMLRW